MRGRSAFLTAVCMSVQVLAEWTSMPWAMLFLA
jgi:hypothetical protein